MAVLIYFAVEAYNYAQRNVDGVAAQFGTKLSNFSKGVRKATEILSQVSVQLATLQREPTCYGPEHDDALLQHSVAHVTSLNHRVRFPLTVTPTHRKISCVTSARSVGFKVRNVTLVFKDGDASRRTCQTVIVWQNDIRTALAPHSARTRNNAL